LKKSSRAILRIRSSKTNLNEKSGLRLLSKNSSRALYDPYEQFDYFYKIIFIGDESVGKTNLLSRIT
jgi:hypothetical protein